MQPLVGARVIETYPVLTMIALGWMLPDSRPTGRLPKYNPERKQTFERADWVYVCGHAIGTFIDHGLFGIAEWLAVASNLPAPRKSDQDRLDACLCLLVALHLIDAKHCLMVGNPQSGYIVVPDGVELRGELEERCLRTAREPSEWVRAFRLVAATV